MRTLFRWTGRLIALITAGALLAGLIDPRTFWLPAIFTPVLPWMILTVLGLTVWLGYRKKYREALLPLAVLLLALPALQKTVAWSAPKTGTEDANDVSLVTANVVNLKAPRQQNFPLDSAGIRQLVERLNADILLLQEYYFLPGKWRTGLIRSVGKYEHVAKAEGGSLVIFSRFPLRGVEESFLNSVNGHQVVDLYLPTDTVRLINVHLQSNRVTGMANNLEKERDLTKKDNWRTVKQMFGRYGRATGLRTDQAERISEIIWESPHPVVVGGDFNDVPTSFPYRVLVSPRRLNDAWIKAGTGLGATYAGALPGLRIDYVLVDTSLMVRSAEVLPEGASDHRPLRVVVEQ